ncbi:hypothetical protein [Brachybacterium sp. Z12]|uniref:hypothetical protein n=1 Tax=Brachybacterium sp. Z12 TaxID=2759167 RepID=UPI00223C3D63|nr:hypothetical protein [Brachybacterium sp. Z12]
MPPLRTRLPDHLVDEVAHRLGAGLRGGALPRLTGSHGAIEAVARHGELAATEVRGAGGEGVLAGVDPDQHGGVLAQHVVAGRPSSLHDALVAAGRDLVEPAGLLELGTYSEHRGPGEAGRGHRVGGGERLRPQSVLHQRLAVRVAHQLRGAGAAIARC